MKPSNSARHFLFLVQAHSQLGLRLKRKKWNGKVLSIAESVERGHHASNLRRYKKLRTLLARDRDVWSVLDQAGTSNIMEQSLRYDSLSRR